MNILITGCFGFIGFNFLNFLTNNHRDDFKVTGIDVFKKPNFNN